MSLTRRTLLAGAVAATVARPGLTLTGASTHDRAERKDLRHMYGLIGQMKAVPGQRDALIAILLEGTGAMPGCLSYIVARDPADADGLWITEAWDDEASHKASLSLPAVQEAIGKGRPLIAGFGARTVTEPVGGVGLPRSG